MPTWVIHIQAISFRCVSASGFHANTHKSRVLAQGSFVLPPTRQRRKIANNFLSMVMIHFQTIRSFVNRNLYFYPLTHSELSVNTHICSDFSERSEGAEEVCRKAHIMKKGPTWVDKNKHDIRHQIYTLFITTTPYFLRALRTLK